MNIYTRNGDFGLTTTIHGEPISKSSPLIELQGAIDEVNSFTGLLRSLLTKHHQEVQPSALEGIRLLMDELKDIQHQLFTIGSDLSGQFNEVRISDAHITDLENAIDRMLESTGELHHFLYLSGHEAATTAHCLRSITRRCERDFVRYLEANKRSTPPTDYKYINRLADYFFQSSRFINWALGIQEEQMSL